MFLKVWEEILKEEGFRCAGRALSMREYKAPMDQAKLEKVLLEGTVDVNETAREEIQKKINLSENEKLSLSPKGKGWILSMSSLSREGVEFIQKISVIDRIKR